MKDGNNHFVTGATGFIGRRHVMKVLDEEPETTIYALVRRNSVNKLREKFPAEFDDRVIPVIGDLTTPYFGASQEDYAGLVRRITSVKHFGAATEFYAKNPADNELIALTNIQGTKNVVAFALACRKNPILDWVGTAYTAGNNQGLIMEDELSENNGFKNTYERSKWESEKLVRDAMAHEGLLARIIKPSIVLGDSVTLDSEGEGRMMYGYTDGIGKIIRYVLRRGGEDFNAGIESGDPREMVLRLIGNASPRPATRKDLVFVDDVIDTMYAIQQSGEVGHAYHITNEKEITGDDIAPAIEYAFNIKGIRYVGKVIDDPSPVEVAIMDVTAPFIPYTLNSDPPFDTTNTRRATAGRHNRRFMTPRDLENLLRHHVLTYFLRKKRVA